MTIDKDNFDMDPSWIGLLYCDIPERTPIENPDSGESNGVHRPGHCAGEWCSSSNEVDSERRVISRGICCGNQRRRCSRCGNICNSLCQRCSCCRECCR